MPLTLILQTTDESTSNKSQNTQAGNQDVLGAASGADGGRIGGSIKNLSIVTNLAKFKKSKSTKSKKLDLLKANFAKANLFRTDFLTLNAKKAIIYL